jgi:small-conductance mechanosensitive channel
VLGVVCAEGVSAATGVQLNSILSFAGLGGIALGLATKDMLTNLVGGCILFLTNPFSIPLGGLEDRTSRRCACPARPSSSAACVARSRE